MTREDLIESLVKDLVKLPGSKKGKGLSRTDIYYALKTVARRFIMA